MNEVVLTGQLICSGTLEADIVRQYLPRHTELTRSEPGCRSFEVRAADEPLVWQVEERFVDVAAFQAHQHRVRLSEWGRQTASIRRNYSVSEVSPDDA